MGLNTEMHDYLYKAYNIYYHYTCNISFSCSHLFTVISLFVINCCT